MIVKVVLSPVIGFLAVVVANVTPAYAADRQNLFDWYYSAVFGTGSYSIDNRDVFVVTVPFDKQLRGASDDKHEIVLRAPITLGFYDYDYQNIIELEIPTDVATLTFFPGIYYIIPLTKNWTIKPFANLGYGKEFEGGEEAWIYSAGSRSLYQLRDDEWRIALGNSLYYAGNTREAQTDLGFAAFDAAIDINRATPWTIDNKTMYLGGYAAVYIYTNLEFITSEESTIEINEQFEIAITLSASDTMTIWGMEMERIGLGYLTSDGFRAWRLVFSFPY